MKTKRGGFPLVVKATLETQASPIFLLHLQNLFTRMGKASVATARVDAALSRAVPPRFDLSLHVTREDAETPEGKVLLKAATQLVSSEVTGITLTLEWPEGEPPEKAADLIRSLAREVEETVTARMSAVVRRKE